MILDNLNSKTLMAKHNKMIIERAELNVQSSYMHKLSYCLFQLT